MKKTIEGRRNVLSVLIIVQENNPNKQKKNNFKARKIVDNCKLFREQTMMQTSLSFLRAVRVKMGNDLEKFTNKKNTPSLSNSDNKRV